MKNSTRQIFILFGITLCVGLYALSDYVMTPHESEGFVKACSENWHKHQVTASTAIDDAQQICTCISKHMNQNNADIVNFTTLTAWFTIDKPNTASHRDTVFGKRSEDLFMDGLLYCINHTE